MDGLSPERWKRIDELFAAALELEPSERDAFVRRACDGDDDLYHEVLALLESEAAAEAAIGDSVDTFAAPLLAELDADSFAGDDAAFAPGVRVGAYRIVHEIGRGGMGAVYLAERADEELEERVALKVVTRGMDTDDVLRRFRHEWQILASLEHPNIARLLDGGATSDGRPYLVMEHIEGEPIDAYCDRRRLGIRERLELFRAVCDAVQHAHQRLVVHRDIKPSNILVTDAGAPKLLDFGIAKLLDDSPPDATAHTRTDLRMLTPEYASPEQVRGDPVTTASDVYALGVVLYRLLSGRPPHQAHGLPVAEAERAVDQEPPPPSVAAARSAEAGAAEADALTIASPADVARSRGTTPGALRRTLRGDLDTITLKALAKDPQRRYDSPARLADDIGRYLAGLPITARAPGTAYVAARFVRRRRAGVTAAAAFVLLLAGSAAALGIVQARTVRALAQAEHERATAEEVASFLESMFSANPLAVGRERLDTLRVRALLDRGAERIGEELAGRPAVHARMLRIIGRTYRELGDDTAAEPLLAEALDHARASEQPREVADALTDLGRLHLARGRPGDAEPFFREALLMRQEAGTATAPSDLATALANLAASLQDPRRMDEAAPLYDSAIATLRAAPALDSASLEAERLYREAIEIQRAALGEDHPDVAILTGKLARVLCAAGRGRQAVPLLERAASTLDRALPPGHPGTLEVRLQLGRCLAGLGSHADAEGILLATLDAVDAGGPTTAVLRPAALRALEELYSTWGQPERAAEYAARLRELE